MEVINSGQLYSEPLFSLGIKADDFAFLSQDARGFGASVAVSQDITSQTRQTLSHLQIALEAVKLTFENLVSLTVFLTDYRDVPAVATALKAAFPQPHSPVPASTMLGVMGLEGGCRVRIDAIATSNPDREQIIHADIPLPVGALCHCVRVGDLFFLSGVDAADAEGCASKPANIESQTVEVLNRIEAILNTRRLNLGHIFRTFMFIPGTEHRIGYRDTRRKRYHGIFADDEFPANSGIYVKDLGKDILLRSVAIAYSGNDKSLITSSKVWLAPGSFSQAFRIGEWLFISGQDAIREVNHSATQRDVLSPDVRRAVAYEAEAVGDLAGQTKASLRHVKDIVEQAGGTLDDIVKTTVYLISGQDRGIFATAYQEFFSSHRKDRNMPAGLSVEVKELAPDCLVEIDAVALLRT